MAKRTARDEAEHVRDIAEQYRIALHNLRPATVAANFANDASWPAKIRVGAASLDKDARRLLAVLDGRVVLSTEPVMVIEDATREKLTGEEVRMLRLRWLLAGYEPPRTPESTQWRAENSAMPQVWKDQQREDAKAVDRADVVSAFLRWLEAYHRVASGNPLTLDFGPGYVAPQQRLLQEVREQADDDYF